MANISNKDLVGHESGVTEVSNWISQINAGGQTYDIATHHSVTFVDGQGGTQTVWNGLSDIQVVIPSVADIVQTPIEFVGTVGKDGKVVDDKGSEITTFEKGNLVFITEGCTFADQVCEGGDMAIYNGSNWNVVSGENQVELIGTTDENKRITVAVGAAQDVLEVEGKKLSLTLNYADINTHLVKGDVEDIAFTKASVDSTYIKLTKGEDKVETISADHNFEKATKLADGTVDLKNATGLVNDIDWGAFNPGTKTDFAMNSAKEFTVSGGKVDLTSGQTTGAFVDSVSMDAVSFVKADESDENKIKFVTDIVADKGAEFLNGIHVTGKDETADFTIDGYIAPEVDGVEFVSGLEDNVSKVVTAISTGSVTLKNGSSDIAVGFGAAQEGKGGDVLSDVTVTAKNDTNVLKSAKVVDHVLSFDDINVTSNVDVTYYSKSLTKDTIVYTAPVATETGFVKSGFKKVDNVSYTFGRGNETVYTAPKEMYKINTPTIATTFGTYTFNDAGMKASVGEGVFVSSVTPGDLPSLAPSTLKRVDVTGTVGTDLTTVTETIHALKSDVNSITLPGAYALENGAANDGVSLEVGKAGVITELAAEVDLKSYVIGCN